MTDKKFALAGLEKGPRRVLEKIERDFSILAVELSQ